MPRRAAMAKVMVMVKLQLMENLAWSVRRQRRTRRRKRRARSENDSK
jgi:hypothetical protein